MRIFFFFLLLSGMIHAGINSNGDFQIWNHNEVQKSFTDRFSIGLDNEFRIGDDAKKLFYIHKQLSFIFDVYQWLDIRPSYRQIWNRGNTTPWKTIYNPLLDVQFNFFISKVKFQNRNRVQYFIFPSQSNRWQYRNRVRFAYPIDIANSKVTMSPFISNEVFFFEGRGFHQDRLAVGSAISYGEIFLGRLFYMRRFLELGGSWKHHNVLGIRIYFYF